MACRGLAGRTHGKELVDGKAEGLDIYGCQVRMLLHGGQAHLLSLRSPGTAAGMSHAALEVPVPVIGAAQLTCCVMVHKAAVELRRQQHLAVWAHLFVRPEGPALLLEARRACRWRTSCRSCSLSRLSCCTCIPPHHVTHR